ncbi:MAG: sigma-70 family RNA polymerase sigma factor [Anaerolineae bacterium]|nr:sigma-70 family RNA polymerase sigma factor [Anaerolineae bacterium]
MARYREYSDAQLVAACRHDEAEAWDELIARYERLVYTIPLRYGLSPAEAEDVFQTTWMALLEKLATLNEPDRVSAWLVTTARRATWDRRRGAENERTESFNPAELPDGMSNATPEEIVAEFQLQQRARQALAKLGERCRRLLYYLYQDHDDPTYADIAQIMGMTTGSIGPTRARCLEKLRALLEEDA